MTYALTENVAKVLSLFTEIQECACHLRFEEAEVIDLFFVAKMTVIDVSYVCDITQDQACQVITCFLNDLLTRSRELTTLLAKIARRYDVNHSALFLLRKEEKDRLIARVCHLAADDTENSLEARIRDVVGSGLGLSTPKGRARHHCPANSETVAPR